MKPIDRRQLLELSLAGLCLPAMGSILSACASQKSATGNGDLASPPASRPADWNPVTYNTTRGAAGFIPPAYMKDIQAEGGDKKHLGKHLPYVPASFPADRKVEGYLPIMWGDPDKGNAKHPNASKTPEKPDGHWYNWIRLSLDGQSDSLVETRFDDWPKCSDTVNGRLAGCVDPDPAAEEGKNTVYLAVLPKGAKPGDTLRVWAHCITHGEYVDFVTI
ncbi:MAG: hypothetical protein HY791_03850 [Deltaproteobacteria bacterium]|nr:hypothetical protein [Deltaproteobacteria bacterium]